MLPKNRDVVEHSQVFVNLSIPLAPSKSVKMIAELKLASMPAAKIDPENCRNSTNIIGLHLQRFPT